LSDTRLISQKYNQQYLDELVLIPNGTFQMGLPMEKERAANDE
jgi:formylglycine-generating enzyme required for sulfatase activity